MNERGIRLIKADHSIERLHEYSGPDPVLGFCRDWLLGIPEFRFYSSGSTGKPREFLIGRKQMEWSAMATARALNPLPEDCYLLCLHPDTAGGRMVLVRALEWNMDLLVVPESSNPLKQLPDDHNCTWVSLVPYQLSRILEDPESIRKLNRMRVILLGGAAVSEVLAEQIKGLSPQVFHTYGMTETCSHVALRCLNGPDPQEAFHALPGIKTGLAPDGTLWIDAPSAIRRPLSTNDLAEFLPDGSFRILGRKDFTINSGGVKIQVEEIEHLIDPVMRRYLPGRDFFLYGIPSAVFGQELALFIEGSPVDTGPLMSAIKTACPEYKSPRSVTFLHSFLRTASGKIDRWGSAAMENRG